MKKTFLLLCACACMAGTGKRLYAQSQEDMQKWMAYMTPGDMHKLLAGLDGKWNGEISMWMAPGQPPSVSKGVAENKMILGGRYQESVSKGDFGGMPFEGRSVMGYDNARKMFFNSWIDNMGTGVMNLEGPYDPVTKTITLKGTSIDPMTGKDMKVRETFKLIDNNTQVMEMYTVMNGKEMKTMEIKYTRM